MTVGSKIFKSGCPPKSWSPSCEIPIEPPRHIVSRATIPEGSFKDEQFRIPVCALQGHFLALHLKLQDFECGCFGDAMAFVTLR